MDWDWIGPGAQVVAAGAAAAAAIASWLALKRVANARRGDVREARLAAVQRSLLELKGMAANQDSYRKEIDVARRGLLIDRELLSLEDLGELPTTADLVKDQVGITPDLVETAINELAVLRGRDRGGGGA